MSTPSYSNRLVNETSQYLLQHAHNPVDWYPWGDEALEEAQKSGKLLIISIGYASCHWCHVMEHESFENEEVAKIMNDNYISIKIDREERPDIDHIYMIAIQLINGSGGWPLNCIALPDGRPIFGGTYFRKNQWLDTLEKISVAYKADPLRLYRAADELVRGISGIDVINTKNSLPEISVENIRASVKNWSQQFDNQFGGSKQAPKFPMPNKYEFLLQYYFHTNDVLSLKHILITLDSMACGGIYDQIGGGFSRYSIDEKWHIPHFEKMLYDNAQLVSLYCHAYQLTQNTLYKRIVEETLAFAQRELMSPEGGFYSSIDADSEGIEGKYYRWTKAEIENVLQNDSEMFCKYFNITSAGNWENQYNILYINKSASEYATKYSLSEENFQLKIEECKRKLFIYRRQRISPQTDDKILTSWNALTIKAFTDAYRVFGKTEYVAIALKNAEYICKYLLTNNLKLLHTYRYHLSDIPAFLDDYSFTCEAFIALYQSTLEEQWLVLVKKMAEQVLKNFYDSQNGMFFYTTNEQNALFTRKTAIFDNVIPSSNSSIAKVFALLGTYFYENKYTQIAKQMVYNIQNQALKNPEYNTNWLQLALNQVFPPFEVVIIGSQAIEYRNQIDRQYRPNIVIACSKANSEIPIFASRFVENTTQIYICRNNTCMQPTTDICEALKMLSNTEA